MKITFHVRALVTKLREELELLPDHERQFVMELLQVGFCKHCMTSVAPSAKCYCTRDE